MKVRSLWIGVLGLQVLFAGLTLWWLYQRSQAALDAPALIASGLLAFMLIAAQLLFGWYLHLRLFRPLKSLQRGAEIILRTHASHDLELPQLHLLGQLPASIHALGDEIARTRGEVSAALRTGAERVAAQKGHLERVIRGLEEGVIVCDADRRILLYNPAAHRILHQHPALGLGRILFDLLPRTAIEHTLGRLSAGDDKACSFISAVHQKDLLLHCRIGLLNTPEDDAPANDALTGFVLTFDDVTARQNTLHERDRLFRSTLEALRGPLASLRAAAETITDYDDISEEDRCSFCRVISEESRLLSQHLSQLAESESALVGQEWQMADIYSADLIHILTRHLKEQHEFALTMTGVPQWLTTDSHALVALLEQLTRFIFEKIGSRAFDLEATPRPGGIYLDLTWQDRPLTNSELEACQTIKLDSVVGRPEAGELLRQLGGELWSQAHPRLQASAMVRLALPAPAIPAARQDTEQLPTRPMIYDFNLFEDHGQHASLMDRPLRSLDYVVFDTETTGLHPEEGDEVVSIAAVRVVNQRILPDEAFNQLVNPGRPIPRDSIRYHGITDEQVKDAPGIIEVLPQFKAFAKDAVLVAHNAWFDMAFIRRREAQSGAYFTNPILDTLMLSVCLHGHEVDQSLDGIANRLGIDILGRHSAMGDSLATAKILLSQIELLEARGIITLKDALDAYR